MLFAKRFSAITFYSKLGLAYFQQHYAPHVKMHPMNYNWTLKSPKNLTSSQGHDLTLTRAPLGGVWTPPMRFFVNNVKMAARSAAVFGIPYHTSFSHMLWKFRTQVTQGQVTRPRQVTSPRNKFECSSTLHRLNDCLETFSDCYKKENLQNVYLRISISVT